MYSNKAMHTLMPYLLGTVYPPTVLLLLILLLVILFALFLVALLRLLCCAFMEVLQMMSSNWGTGKRADQHWCQDKPPTLAFLS